MTGARNSPAPRNAVAIQNIAVCRCQVRTVAYGSTRASGRPKKPSPSTV
jgi:hypothetical protein